MTSTTYTPRALALIDETIVNGTTVSLVRTTNSPRRYAIVTSGGGSQTGIRTEQSARYHFDKWVAALGRR